MKNTVFEKDITSKLMCLGIPKPVIFRGELNPLKI